MKFFKTNNLLPISLAVFTICSVFFSEKLIPFLVGLILLLFFLEKQKKKNFLDYSKLLVPYILYVSAFLMYTLVSNDLSQALKLLERQVLVIVLPIIIFSSDITKERSIVFIKTYVFLILLTTIISVFKIGEFLIIHEEWINVMNEKNGNFTYVQFKYPHLMGVHPTYWGYLLVLGNILLLNNKTLNIFKNTNLVKVLLVLFNINLFYLSARTPIFINILLHSLSAFYFFNKKSRKELLVYMSVFFSICFVFLMQPLMFFKLSATIIDDRFFLWPKAFEIIKNNYFILGEGLGAGNNILKDYIFEIYDTRSNYFGIDLHNQYLKTYLDMGILGFLTLIYVIIFPLVLSIRSKTNFIVNLSFSLLFLLCVVTESALYTIKGIIIFTIFSSLLIKILMVSKQFIYTNTDG